MSYFRQFPLAYYKIQLEQYLVKDILRRSAVGRNLPNVTGIYEEYVIQDGEKPEDVSFKFYESPTLHWVIMLFNEIHSPFFEWPLTQLELQSYCESVYKDNLYSVHHYEKEGYVIGESKEYDKEAIDYVWIPPSNPGPQDPSVVAVSIYDYENSINESKRIIKILNPDLLQDFIKQFNISINV